jgi:putative transposase
LKLLHNNIAAMVYNVVAMPSRNTVKVDLPHTYYHVYGRGNSKSKIFRDDQDSAVFLSLFKRYLSDEPQPDPYGSPYPHISAGLDLACYCLMSNHFHLLVFQRHAGAMSRLMRAVLTSYTRYFNTKYSLSGPLLESRYKAAITYNQQYLEHITRYIHLNPREWRDYEHSSLPYYLGARASEWLRPNSILELFPGPIEYLQFLEDYADHKRSIASFTDQLANTITP